MKLSNSAAILNQYLSDIDGKPFVWGNHDCCLFVANYLKMITGVDYAAEYRGKYTTAVGAARALKRHGGGDVLSMMNSKFISIRPSFAQRCGMVCYEFDGMGNTVGLCVGEKSAFVALSGDIVYVPTLDCHSAWRVE
jgi:hypothetical protein